MGETLRPTARIFPLSPIGIVAYRMGRSAPPAEGWLTCRHFAAGWPASSSSVSTLGRLSTVTVSAQGLPIHSRCSSRAMPSSPRDRSWIIPPASTTRAMSVAALISAAALSAPRLPKDSAGVLPINCFMRAEFVYVYMMSRPVAAATPPGPPLAGRPPRSRRPPPVSQARAVARRAGRRPSPPPRGCSSSAAHRGSASPARQD